MDTPLAQLTLSQLFFYGGCALAAYWIGQGLVVLVQLILLAVEARRLERKYMRPKPGPPKRTVVTLAEFDEADSRRR